jgi:hypothetical protein
MPQIIIQGDGSPEEHFAIWSASVQDFTYLSLTEDELVRHFASLAYETERAKVLKTIDELRKGGKPYRGAQLTWGEANKRAYEAHPNEYDIRPPKM